MPQCLKCLTVPEVAKALTISRSHTYKMIANGKLRIIKVGRRTVVPMASIQDFIAASLDEADTQIEEAAQV